MKGRAVPRGGDRKGWGKWTGKWEVILLPTSSSFQSPLIFLVHYPVFHTSSPALHEPMSPNFHASHKENTHDAIQYAAHGQRAPRVKPLVSRFFFCSAKGDTLHMAKEHGSLSLWCPASSSAPPHPPNTFPAPSSFSTAFSFTSFSVSSSSSLVSPSSFSSLPAGLSSTAKHASLPPIII